MMPNPLVIRTDKEGKRIIMIFDPVVGNFVMDPEQADKLGTMLIEKARELMPKKILKGSRCPSDWQPTANDIAWTAKNRPDIVIHATRDAFVDFWTAKAGKDGLKIDWSATWRNWCRNTKRGDMPKQQPPPIRDESKPDISGCLRCHGARQWYPNGYGNGVAPCREHVFADLPPIPAPSEVVVAFSDYAKKVSMG